MPSSSNAPIGQAVRSFLRHSARIVVGALLAIGSHVWVYGSVRNVDLQFCGTVLLLVWVQVMIALPILHALQRLHELRNPRAAIRR